MSDDNPSQSAAKPQSAFAPLPDELDFPSMERRMLELWAAEDTFERLRAKNADGPRWSFFDGPITANNPMGVHHAWGRTYKDVYQRYRAMRGYHQRYQNGFDCQGLWLEVEVEKDLGFNSKRDIEAFGLEAFADACRERVEKFSGVQTRQSIRLGQWMDWDDSYYTHSDTNIEHIWHFLRRCNEARLDRGGPARHALVRSLRHRPLPARTHRHLRRGRARRRLRAAADSRTRRHLAAHLDHHALDPGGPTWRRPSIPT